MCSYELYECPFGVFECFGWVFLVGHDHSWLLSPVESCQLSTATIFVALVFHGVRC